MVHVLRFMCLVAMVFVFLAQRAEAQNSAMPAGLAFVIGNSDQATIPVSLAEKDAGLVAAALSKRGFNVFGARNLDHTLIKSAFADFMAEVKSMPSLPVVLYLGGPMLQLDQDNYLLPSDVPANTPATVKPNAVSVNSIVSELERLSSAPKLVILDGARWPQNAAPLSQYATGLTPPSRARNTIFVLNQTPGLTTIDMSAANYGPFALAWSDAFKRGAPDLNALINLVILRTFDISKGQQIPFRVGQVDHDPALFVSKEPLAKIWDGIQQKPMNELDANQGFAAALLRGSLISYEEYILIHIQNPMTRIARALLAPLREAQIWQDAMAKPSAEGAWAYLKLYPRGPHAAEALATLAALGRPATPPLDQPILALTGAEPTSGELPLLAQIQPYRLDETTLELATVAKSLTELLPALEAADRDPPKSMVPSSLYALPLPPLADADLKQIQLPKSLPNIPVPPSIEPSKKSAKPATPMPPARLPSSPDGEGATLSKPAPAQTIIAPTKPAQPVLEPIPTPKPKTDVFDNSFGSSSGQMVLPY